MTDDARPATEGDREWRDLTQQTNPLAEELEPPHDDEAERGAPAPVPGEAEDDRDDLLDRPALPGPGE